MANKSRSKKKDKFTQEVSGKSRIKPLYVIGLLVAAFIVYSMFGGAGFQQAEALPQTQSAAVGKPGSQPQSDRDPDNLYISLSKVDDGKAHFYEHQSATGKTLRFFILKSSDGVFRAAFDACDVCYREKKGYRQEGDDMICNNCGRRFPSNKINVEQGGCNPAPLNREMEDGYLVIKKSDIEAGARYF